MNKVSGLGLIFLSVFSVSGIALSKPVVTKEDYQRAAKFQMDMRKMVHQIKVVPTWLPDDGGFWYLHETSAGNTFMKVSFASLKAQALFDHQALAKILSKKFKLEARASELPFKQVTFLDQHSMEFEIKGDSYLFDLERNQLRKNKSDDKASSEGISPDGKWVAFSESYNLWVRSVATGDVFQLSQEGRRKYEYANEYQWDDTIEGENGERPRRLSVKWSPDSKRILTSIWDFRDANKMHLLDWSIEERYRPQLLSYYRASPGDEAILKEIPVIFDVDKRQAIIPKLPSLSHINSANLEWSADGQSLLGYYLERGYKKLHVVMIDAGSGSVKRLFSDESNTNIEGMNFNYKSILSADKTFVEKVLLTSSRSGWNQIYCVDVGSGKISSVTDGAFVVKAFIHFDEAEKMLYFTAAGKEATNPYYNFLYRVRSDGRDLTLLTPEKVNHEIYMAPSGEYFLDNYSTSAQETVSVVRRSDDGTIVLALNKADASALYAYGWKPPEVFTAIAKDGKTEIYAAIWKPTHFDPAKHYPIIDHSYTGPHMHVFPNDFDSALSRYNQALAELGFVVIMVDGLGTYGRSKAFHDWSYRKLGYALEDHIIAIKELGRRYPWADISKVGIFGHSAGGYDATQALLRFPDFYKVGVSSSADHDHRMEKAWWPEMYMGWPVDSAYHEQSNITMASHLKGKLLITHGGIDENVNPSATFKLAEALIMADKEFDLLIFPSQSHYYKEKSRSYFIKKRWNYFIEHLLGAETLWPIEFPE